MPCIKSLLIEQNTSASHHRRRNDAMYTNGATLKILNYT